MSSTTPSTVQVEAKKPPLRLFNMILFSVCAIMLLSQFTLTAEIGPTSIFWTIVIIVFFFVPYGLITAELGSTYPDAGGIYSWVVRAFGKRWGTRVSWWYWVNVALWVPSVYVMFAGTLSSMFFHDSLSFWVQVIIAIALIWVNYFVNSRTLELGAWVANLGAGITMAVTLILAVVAAIYASHSGSATDFSVSAMLPTGGIHAIVLALPIIIYNFLGFELMSAASGDMRDPKHDVPKSIGIAAVLIGGFYLIATIAMQVIQPAGDISETTGLIGTLQLALGSSPAATAFVDVLGVGALYCFFACLIPWTIGANLSAAESSTMGDLPRIFGRRHPTRNTPIGAALMTSIVGTVVTLAYAIGSAVTNGAVDDLFWSLFAFSSVIFLFPYVVLMLVFLKLRAVDAGATRPYRVPGGPVFLKLLAWIPIVLLAGSVVFFVVDPFDFDWTVTVPILIGIVVAVVIGEVLVVKAPKWVAQRQAEAAAESGTATSVPNLVK
jgi:amino acid transporter